MNVVNPIGMAIDKWCDFTARNLAPFVAPMKLEKEVEWRQWGVHALQLLRAVHVEAPNPYAFPDFTAWAVRFNQEIQAL